VPAYPALLRQPEVSRSEGRLASLVETVDAARPFSTAVPGMPVLAPGTSSRGGSADRSVAVELSGGLKPRRGRPKHRKATNATRSGARLFAFSGLLAEWVQEVTGVCGLATPAELDLLQ